MTRRCKRSKPGFAQGQISLPNNKNAHLCVHLSAHFVLNCNNNIGNRLPEACINPPSQQIPAEKRTNEAVGKDKGDERDSLREIENERGGSDRQGRVPAGNGGCARRQNGAQQKKARPELRSLLAAPTSVVYRGGPDSILAAVGRAKLLKKDAQTFLKTKRRADSRRPVFFRLLGVQLTPPVFHGALPLRSLLLPGVHGLAPHRQRRGVLLLHIATRSRAGVLGGRSDS